MTVAGGYGYGKGTNQLSYPCGLFVNDEQTVYIADYGNHRIVSRKADAKTDEVLAGEKGKGNRLDQLDEPTDVIVDRETDTLFICDSNNRRVMRWPRRPTLSTATTTSNQGQIVTDNINCYGLTIDDQGSLYVSDWKQHEVRRYDKGSDKKGTVIAGGHGEGKGDHQLNFPTYLFVDGQSTLYVSDTNNHRVIKWMKGASEGIIVAGGNGEGPGLNRLSSPQGVWVDGYGHVYVVDCGNHRVMRWEKEAKEGTIIVGGNGRGPGSYQLNRPMGLFFDRHSHVYVAEYSNHRVQRFSIA